MEKSPFSKLDHIGVVVRDFDRAVKHYESLGIGPFLAVEGLSSIERRMYGKVIPIDSFKLKEKNARMGSVMLQLMQPVEGETIWKEFLDKRGEGIQHLGFLVDDIDKEEARMVAKGYTVLYRSRFKGGGGSNYFDTGKVGGVLIELIQWPPNLKWLPK